MGIDRRTLSSVDRKLLAGLETDEQWRMVRVPASEAIWSAWKRYCSAIGVSMGRAIAALIQRELETVIGTETMDDPLAETEFQLRSREGALDERERRLVEREQAMMKRERLLYLAGRPAASAESPKVGRNDPCRCGSGLKYKRCHGSV